MAKLVQLGATRAKPKPKRTSAAIDVRHLSVACARCARYLALDDARDRGDGWHVYRYGCDAAGAAAPPPADGQVPDDSCATQGDHDARAIVRVELPAELDAFARGDDPVDGPDGDGPLAFSVRNLSLRCVACDDYLVLAHYQRLDEDWHRYVYECEPSCGAEPTRVWLEVPVVLDQFARRDPTWRGGARHGGALPESAPAAE
ncbi:MAG: hypothetical protein AAF772_20755 [Acidobacteriota bacterium]